MTSRHDIPELPQYYVDELIAMLPIYTGPTMDLQVSLQARRHQALSFARQVWYHALQAGMTYDLSIAGQMEKIQNDMNTEKE